MQGSNNADLAAGVRQARIPSGERGHDLPSVGLEANAGQGGDGAGDLRLSVSRVLGLVSSRALRSHPKSVCAKRLHLLTSPARAPDGGLLR